MVRATFSTPSGHREASEGALLAARSAARGGVSNSARDEVTTRCWKKQRGDKSSTNPQQNVDSCHFMVNDVSVLRNFRSRLSSQLRWSSSTCPCGGGPRPEYISLRVFGVTFGARLLRTPFRSSERMARDLGLRKSVWLSKGTRCSGTPGQCDDAEMLSVRHWIPGPRLSVGRKREGRCAFSAGR